MIISNSKKGCFICHISQVIVFIRLALGWESEWDHHFSWVPCQNIGRQGLFCDAFSFLGPSWQALLMKRWQRHLLMADIWLSVDGHMFPATNALFASYWQFSAWHVPYPSCTTWRTSMRNPHWAPLKSFITTFSPLLTDPGHDGHDFARRPARAKRDTSIKKSSVRWAVSRNLSQKENLSWSTENPDIEPAERFINKRL